MLSLRLQSLLYMVRSSLNRPQRNATNQIVKSSSVEATSKAITDPAKTEATKTRQKYSNFHKKGPQLEITRIIIQNGPLTSKQIYRSYLYNLEQKRKNKKQIQLYFNSLTHLKKTIGYMRTNGKLISCGYDKKKRVFLGWKLDQKRALKYVHPQVVKQLEILRQSKDTL